MLRETTCTADPECKILSPLTKHRGNILHLKEGHAFVVTGGLWRAAAVGNLSSATCISSGHASALKDHGNVLGRNWLVYGAAARLWAQGAGLSCESMASRFSFAFQRKTVDGPRQIGL